VSLYLLRVFREISEHLSEHLSLYLLLFIHVPYFDQITDSFDEYISNSSQRQVFLPGVYRADYLNKFD
jgi:hypothetical protein